MPMKIAVLVGSLRRDSFNRKLAQALAKLAGDAAVFDYPRLDDLPLYNQDFDDDYPSRCKQFKQQIANADAVLFVTPEYNRSIPGVLKNAIDIASRPYGTSAFARKPGALIGTSRSAAGTAMAQQHLRNVCVFLDIRMLAQPEAFIRYKDDLIDADGNITIESTRKFLRDFIDRYIAWVKRFTD